MNLKKFIKQKPYIFGAIVIFILAIIGVSTWLILESQNSNLITPLNESTVSNNTPNSATGPNNTLDVDCVVTYPDTWGPCSPSGVKTATGTITTYPTGTGAKCGPLTITAPCPVDCVVDWSNWSPCSYSGIHTSTGKITRYPLNNGKECPTNLTQSGTCAAPIDCLVTYPDTWGPCTASGVKTATGTIVTPAQNGGAECPPLTISTNCQIDEILT